MERFWNKVFKTNRCWLWTGGLTSTKPGKGYGVFGYKGRNVLAHRFSYEMAGGEIPSGLQIDHLCRTRCCVNPEHLEVVTGSENCRRGLSGQWKRPNICKRGHEMTKENTYIPPNSGGRECYICRKQNNKNWKRARAAMLIATQETQDES